MKLEDVQDRQELSEFISENCVEIPPEMLESVTGGSLSDRLSFDIFNLIAISKKRTGETKDVLVGKIKEFVDDGSFQFGDVPFGDIESFIDNVWDKIV